MVTTRRNSDDDITNDIRMVFGSRRCVTSPLPTPAEAEDWITHMEKLFQVLGCPDNFKTRLAAFNLEGDTELVKKLSCVLRLEGDAFADTSTGTYLVFSMGAQGFLASVMGHIIGDSTMKIFSVVRDTLILFPMNFPRLPPAREIEFGIIVLEILRQKKLYAKFLKVRVLGLQQVAFLGHICICNDIFMDPSKVKLHQLAETYYGDGGEMFQEALLGYYRRFLMRKGEKFVWKDERQESFEELKWRLVSAPILTLPSGSGSFQIYMMPRRKLPGFCIEDPGDTSVCYVKRGFLVAIWASMRIESNLIYRSSKAQRDDVRLLAIVHNVEDRSKLIHQRLVVLLQAAVGDSYDRNWDEISIDYVTGLLLLRKDRMRFGCILIVTKGCLISFHFGRTMYYPDRDPKVLHLVFVKELQKAWELVLRSVQHFPSSNRWSVREDHSETLGRYVDGLVLLEWTGCWDEYMSRSSTRSTNEKVACLAKEKLKEARIRDIKLF
ncbi:hypothetical protein Tco_0691550 [Tanacetum coccineum]